MAAFDYRLFTIKSKVTWVEPALSQWRGYCRNHPDRCVAWSWIDGAFVRMIRCMGRMENFVPSYHNLLLDNPYHLSPLIILTSYHPRSINCWSHHVVDFVALNISIFQCLKLSTTVQYHKVVHEIMIWTWISQSMCFLPETAWRGNSKIQVVVMVVAVLFTTSNPPSTPRKTLRRSKGCPFFKVREGKRNGHVKSLCPRKGRLDDVIFLSVGLYSSVPSLGTPSMIQSHRPIEIIIFIHILPMNHFPKSQPEPSIHIHRWSSPGIVCFDEVNLESSACKISLCQHTVCDNCMAMHIKVPLAEKNAHGEKGVKMWRCWINGGLFSNNQIDSEIFALFGCYMMWTSSYFLSLGQRLVTISSLTLEVRLDEGDVSGVACPEPNCRLPITEDILKRIFGSDSPATWRQRWEWRGKIPTNKSALGISWSKPPTQYQWRVKVSGNLLLKME